MTVDDKMNFVDVFGVFCQKNDYFANLTNLGYFFND